MTYSPQRTSWIPPKGSVLFLKILAIPSSLSQSLPSIMLTVGITSSAMPFHDSMKDLTFVYDQDISLGPAFQSRFGGSVHATDSFFHVLPYHSVGASLHVVSRQSNTSPAVLKMSPSMPLLYSTLLATNVGSVPLCLRRRFRWKQ